jgi:serine phosphatase RsbU (regulator of sigma subunit)
MRFGGLGLLGKFVVALLIAAALPFVVGLVIFETTGYQYLLKERGQLHQKEALILTRELEQAADDQGESLRSWVAGDPALLRFVTEKNLETSARKLDEVAQETLRLDQQWASFPKDAPQLTGVLENPGSSSLHQFRTLHPEVAEILVTDRLGRLLSATNKSSDFNQADEAWWQKGATLAKGSKWTDVLSCDASSGVFSLDVVVPLYQGDALAGVSKMSVDVNLLFGGLTFDEKARGARWEMVLPDGRILASSKGGDVSLHERLPQATLKNIRRDKGRGWALVQDGNGESRMAGFVAMGLAGSAPQAYVLFSSPRAEVLGPLQRSLLSIGLAAAFGLAICALAGFWLVRRNILQPLAILGRAARAISATAQLHHSLNDDERKIQEQAAQADLDKIQAIYTGDEIEALAGDLAVMTSRVLRYHHELETEVAAKTAVIREDLEMAREFQHALLPSRYPEVPPAAIHNPLRLQFAHFYQPASSVGGDFFDLIELDENRVGILIADVMGHGARSALITAILRALIRNLSTVASDPGAFLSELNRHLREMISRSGQTLFVTAFFLVLDTRNGRATWAVAGHPAPLRVRRGSGKEPQPLWTLPQHQPALGLIENAVFHSSESPLGAGDVFLLFTDGAVEAENPFGDPFGVERLAASFDEALDGPMAAMPAKIVCDVTAFQKRRHYADDVCLVAVEAVSVIE